MFQLNVLCRAKQNPYHELSYELKNALVKYLYKSGYCIESILHYQDYECWSCGGSGEYYRGVTCYKCDGTGVYRRVWHYAFRFNINGRRFSWHQPKDSVDFKVQELSGDSEKYHDPSLPDKNDVETFRNRCPKAIWRVALFLWLHLSFPLCLDKMPYLREWRWKFLWEFYRLRGKYIKRPIRELHNRLKSWRWNRLSRVESSSVDDVHF
jgi:hypothetical protein